MTVETEANGGAQGVHVKVVLPWLAPWARRAGTRDFCPSLAALVDPVLAVHYFTYLSPMLSKLGGQSCRVACLLICVYGANSP
jgi:hypothetical protein